MSKDMEKIMCIIKKASYVINAIAMLAIIIIKIIANADPISIAILSFLCIRDDRVRHTVRRTLGEGIRVSLRKQVLHYADLDYDADEISRLLHVDRRLVLQIEAHRNDPEPATPTEGEQPTLI
ncbi:hypothetical protein [Bifidobacterium pseudocatenulatum]|uniref:hypothetical protein n=1 Tax=Bifidobacterium pseudocatenulatum TaxID=28026 RepID=UPI0034A4D4B3